MSGSQDDDSDKQYDATPKKLSDARKKGEFARSTDLNTAASYGGLILVAYAMGAESLNRMGQTLASLLANPDRFSQAVFSDGGQPFAGGLMKPLGFAAAPWFLVPTVLVIAGIIAQRGFVFAPSKLEFKLSRISLMSNAKNKFGRSGLFEFAKSFSKLLVYSAVVLFFLLNRTPLIVGAIYATPSMASALLVQLAVEFMVIVFLIALAIGGVDYLWQYQENLRRNRMSRKEMTDETKQSEGDPHVKQQRRQKGYAIAMNQMLADVPDADVIVVNPQHYAVALKWSRETGSAPICLAKGVDEIAARIREIASESGVPIHRDPPTARALYATVEIGEEIWPEHYPAIAAAIRFAELMRSKARDMGKHHG